MMKTLKKFLLLFGVLSFSGALYLRWLALAFLYRTMDKYWTGVGTTLASTAALLVVVSLLIARQLYSFEKITAKAKRGEEVSAEERTQALGAYVNVNTLAIIMNTVGFFAGQIAVLIIEVAKGAIEANTPRIILTVIQATFVGAIAALFEIYALNNWMAESRQLLKIQDIEVFGRKGRMSISGRITLTSAVTLGFMGINAFCSAFALIKQSQEAAPAANIMSEYLKSGAASIVATFIPCFLLVRIIATELKGRIGTLSERVQGLGDRGDLSSRIYISMNDDFGSLTSRLNGFLDQLSTLIVNLRDETRIVAETARRLSSSTDESKLALTLMKSSVNKIVGEGERQNHQIAEAHGDIQGISENARDVEQQVLVQSAAIQQSSASVNEMAANINSVAELAGKAETLSSRLRLSSSGGETSIKTAVGAITEIQDASREVQAIIQDIQKIASQTNLLSMNAAIEAAHAGEAGQGFAVVANEVGSLASSSAKSAKNIQQHIKNMVTKIDYGVAAISAAGKAFDEINAGIEQTSALIDTISHAMDEQRVGATETLESTNSIVEAINAIKTLSSQQREYTEKMAAAMKGLVDSAKAIDLALRENSDNSASLDGAVQNVGACVVGTNEAIARMKRQIEVFKLA
jgi:methyl-accepting chemotaxis protein